MATSKGREQGKVNAERQRQRHSREFKLEAVRQLERGDKTGVQLAMELGIKRELLYRWRDDLQANGEAGAFPGSGRPVGDQQSEIARLKREVEQLKEERDILKKAAAYFAKELP
jgi:transposase